MNAIDIFTVIPAVDQYNGKPLVCTSRLCHCGKQLSRIAGYCKHLSVGAFGVLYHNSDDAQAWINAHEQYHHEPYKPVS